MLPRTELHSELYPTERMREAVAQLYAQIIEFALMAVRWFKKGKLMHSFAAVVHPFKISFGPVVEKISELSRRVDELANAASKAEIRDQHAKIHSLENRMDELLKITIGICVSFPSSDISIKMYGWSWLICYLCSPTIFTKRDTFRSARSEAVLSQRTTRGHLPAYA